MKKIISAIFAFSLLGLVFVKYMPARTWISEIDYQYFRGLIFWSVGRDAGSFAADQRLYQGVIDNADYGWLANENIWIAHSLGLSGNYANTPAAFAAGSDAGFHIFEVDIRLHDGELYCAHEVNDVESKFAAGCSFDWLVKTAKTQDIWFILDVKTEFESAYVEITRRLSNSAASKKFIPQIYAFNQIKHIDLNLFAGPLFTGYRSSFGADLITQTAANLGLPVVTLPPTKLDKNIQLHGLRIFSHGINTPKEYRHLKNLGVTGFYVRTPLYKKLHSPFSLAAEH